ncbi:MAG TPA: hypothetical protein VHV55_22565 [Pirellulales bacterium]|jgi:hypothetical protein|nr:hypothetical protein [Pirellulales bacterium]
MDEEKLEGHEPPPTPLIVAFLLGSAAIAAALIFIQSWLAAGYTLLFLSAGVIFGWLRAVFYVGRLGYFVMKALCVQYALLAIGLCLFFGFVLAVRFFGIE